MHFQMYGVTHIPRFLKQSDTNEMTLMQATFAKFFQ